MFSCADFTFPLLPHNKALQLIKLLGIEAVDLGIFEGRSHHYPSHIANKPIEEGKRLKNELDALHLKPADVFLQTGEEPHITATNTFDKSIQKNNRTTFLKLLEFTNTLGCKHITGLPGVLHKNYTFEENWERACVENYWRLNEAKAFDITYSIEPHVGSILSDTNTTLKFIKECPNITLTLDYGHFIYQGQTNESVHPLIPNTSHFHARGGAIGKLQTMVSQNQIDFETIFSLLKENSYSGHICLEYVYIDWEGCNRTDNISETIKLLSQLREL